MSSEVTRESIRQTDDGMLVQPPSSENGTEGGNKVFAPSVIEFPSQARYWAKWACPTLNPARDAMSGGAISKKMC